MNITQQKSTEKTWYNEASEPVPYNRTTQFERACEKTTTNLARQAYTLHEKLKDFKNKVQDEARELYEMFLKENNSEPGKGNKVFYNFDRSVKFEANVNESISFDENTIGLAQKKMQDVLLNGSDGLDEAQKTYFLAAFETSSGKLDVKKVMSIRRHARRLKDARFDEVADLIDKAIRRTSSKIYFRVWVKDDSGMYQDINLQFSNL